MCRWDEYAHLEEAPSPSRAAQEAAEAEKEYQDTLNAVTDALEASRCPSCGHGVLLATSGGCIQSLDRQGPDGRYLRCLCLVPPSALTLPLVYMAWRDTQ